MKIFDILFRLNWLIVIILFIIAAGYMLFFEHRKSTFITDKRLVLVILFATLVIFEILIYLYVPSH